jgi:metal-responsive CopG/Arc/MetJ family transcriptional regulator
MSQNTMTTISITLDKEMLQAVESLSHALGMTLSAFMTHALQLALQQQRIKELEEKHRQGYLNHPVGEEEFSVWEDEQVWGD